MAAPPEIPSEERRQIKIRQPRLRILRCTIISASMLLITIGIVALTVWLVIKPEPVRYTVEESRIHGFKLDKNGQLKTTFHIRLTTENRNKKVSIYYDSLEVSVLYENQLLASTYLAPFHQPTCNKTRLAANLASRGVEMTGDAAKDLRLDYRSAGKVEFDVIVKARIRFLVGGIIKSKHYMLKAYCSPVVVYSPDRNELHRTFCDVHI
ncbi:harpin-induced like protein 23 [Zostera marina]|uniref:Harpin-induced like protein 23 n=1 Tax=Zostera marina TaxID=29655 RepID=A0A0K9PEA2_ZOSMR|nr:harpin-induced like protein 23 [Zostera marina]